MNKIVRFALFSSLFLFSVCSYAVTIKTVGKGSAPTLAEAKHLANLEARKLMMKESEKIILTWANLCFPDTDYSFAKIAQSISYDAAPIISKEKVSYSKRSKTYTVTITLYYESNNKDAAERLIHSFERYMIRNNLEYIGYNRETDLKIMKTIVSRW